MIASFSTSGPRASVALISDDCVLYAADEEAQGHAGEACLRLFQEGLMTLAVGLPEIDLFAADLGPGSFTGVRVGIVLAKTLAWAQKAPCAGADAFDLVSPFETVFLPSRRGEWFVRTPRAAPREDKRGAANRRLALSVRIRPTLAPDDLAARVGTRVPHRALDLGAEARVWETVAMTAEPKPRVDLRPYTTLRAGGSADFFLRADNIDTLAEGARWAWKRGLQATPIGWGSNVLPADAGVPGLVILNRTHESSAAEDGEVVADSGIGFGDLFIKTAQRSLAGLEFAVGIPGSIGGALVSNAGAYRSSIAEFLTGLEVATPAGRAWVGPEWMGFSYRDSVLRRPGAPQAIVLRIKMRLPKGDPKRIYDEARDYQRQRISKQPPSPSAGSFFKNVVNSRLAETTPGLTEGMRAAGVVPAGFLIEACGLKGHRIGGAMLGVRHANFLLNVGGATATDLRALAEYAQAVVRQRFGVALEPEVLYLGRW